MANISKQRLNPIELMNNWKWPTSHVSFDENLKGDYQIIRGTSHDGTAIFEDELLQQTLINLASGTSFFKKDEPDFTRLKEIRYTVGYLNLATVYGSVDLPAGNYPGEKQRARIAVKCEYVYDRVTGTTPQQHP